MEEADPNNALKYKKSSRNTLEIDKKQLLKQSTKAVKKLLRSMTTTNKDLLSAVVVLVY